MLDERLFDPPRDVLVENDGRWKPGEQTAWRLGDDGFGWRAAVTRRSGKTTAGVGTSPASRPSGCAFLPSRPGTRRRSSASMASHCVKNSRSVSTPSNHGERYAGHQGASHRGPTVVPGVIPDMIDG